MELDPGFGDPKPKAIFSFISKTHTQPPVLLQLLPPAPHSPPPHHLRLITHHKVLADALVEKERSPKVGKRNRDLEKKLNALVEEEKSPKVGERNRYLEKKLSIKVETDQRGGGTSSRGSYEEQIVSGRKKLRLSKEQSAFLEQSFKEHHTLNPKQKLILAKQLSLLPRQVEVWFQNRRARTKLKQTEVDCGYLKRYCETLGEENRRLQREVQELRALYNTNATNISNPNFHMQLPATTLTICPSCEHVSITTVSKPRLRNTADVRSVASLAC